MTSGISPESFRSRFPIFDTKLFLNSCSKGALSVDVEKAYDAYLGSWKSEGSPWEPWVEVLETTRAECARFLGCSADELAITFCASTAVGAIASALSFHGRRNRVLIGDFEFPTVVYNLMAQQRRGAEIVRVRADRHRLEATAYEGLLDERVCIVPVTHVSFRNGYRQDLEAVVRAARAVGARTLIDDYQFTGTGLLDVHALGCDFLVTGTLKYLLGSSGLAFLYVKQELIEELEPIFTGWFGQERPFDFDIERGAFHATARRFETGTPPIPNLYAGLAGLKLVAGLGTQRIAAHVASLTARLIEGARERGFEVRTPEEPERRGALVVLSCRDSTKVVEHLAREGIVVSSRGSGLRVSFHYYNLPQDVDVLLEALDRLCDGLMVDGRGR